MNQHKTVVAAALGECVHVSGVMNFLRLAEAAGWQEPHHVLCEHCVMIVERDAHAEQTVSGRNHP